MQDIKMAQNRAFKLLSEDQKNLLFSLSNMSERIELVGSRVTCNPPPLDTDQDVLLLAEEEALYTVLQPFMVVTGFEGADFDYIYDAADNTQENTDDFGFVSYRKGDINVIITQSKEFFEAFMEATNKCATENVMDKQKRIAIFQKILYDNDIVF